MKKFFLSMMLAATLPTTAFASVPLVGTVHSSDVGDQRYTPEAWLPTEMRRIEQFEFHVPRSFKGLGLQYRCHLQDHGDSPWLEEGTRCGTTGEARRLESFALRLTGPMAREYSVRYWCHVAGDSRPLGPFRDGEVCGTQGESRELLRMRVEIVKKVGKAPHRASRP